MQRYIFIKPIDHIQLGHLYEHIYCMRLVNYFHHKKLYSYSDYNIDAKTYYSGFIRLEICLYTPQALDEINAIHTLTILFDEDEINGGLLQIFAEKKVDIGYLDTDRVKAKLQEYHQKAWRALDGVDIENSTDTHKTHKGLGFVHRNLRHFMVMKHSISIDADFARTNKAMILPLFAVLSRAIGNNLQELITDSSFCYSYDDHFVMTDKKITDSNLYRIDRRQAVALTTEAEETRTLLQNMYRDGFITKLSHYLQHASTKSLMSPDDEEIMRKTGMVMGPDGWHKIGTTKNLALVLQNMTIEFRLGKTTQTVALKDIF